MSEDRTHKQPPIGSGFTAASTGQDVVAGPDRTGENVIVAGGHSGIGLATTVVLSLAGASVTIGARDTAKEAGRDQARRNQN